MNYTHLTDNKDTSELLCQGLKQSVLAKKIEHTLSSLIPTALSDFFCRHHLIFEWFYYRTKSFNKSRRGWRSKQAHDKVRARLTERGKNNSHKVDKKAQIFAIQKIETEQWIQVTGWKKKRK